MEEFKKAFSYKINDQLVYEARRLVSEYVFQVNGQTVGLKIWFDQYGKYSFSQSHFTNGYVTSRSYGYDSEYEALINAEGVVFDGKTHSTDPNYEHVKWVPNPSY